MIVIGSVLEEMKDIGNFRSEGEDKAQSLYFVIKANQN